MIMYNLEYCAYRKWQKTIMSQHCYKQRTQIVKSKNVYVEGADGVWEEI